MKVWTRIAEWIEQEGSAALVTLTHTAGSVPRGAGTHMVAAPSGALKGTVGGGTLEFDLYRQSLHLLRQAEGRAMSRQVRHVLGPDLGQCCGGVAEAAIEVFTRDDVPWIRPLVLAEQQFGAIETFGRQDQHGRWLRRLAGRSEPSMRPGERGEEFGVSPTALALFGAGHVGRAVMLALAPLPFRVTWIDERETMFPAALPENTRAVAADAPETRVAGLAPGSFVAVMTHSHALDLAVVHAALQRKDLPYVGLIGSETKRARFQSRLAQAGMSAGDLSRLVCPIGGREVRDKSPPVIAALVALELLKMRESLAALSDKSC